MWWPSRWGLRDAEVFRVHFSLRKEVNKPQPKQQSQTKAIKLFIFSCFAVNSRARLRVAPRVEKEISFNISSFSILFSHSVCFPLVVRRFFFISEKNLNRVGLWIITTWSTPTLFLMFLSAQQCYWALCLFLFQLCEHKANLNRFSLSRLIVSLIFHFGAGFAIHFALKMSRFESWLVDKQSRRKITARKR